MKPTRRHKPAKRILKETVYTYTVLFEPAAEGGYSVAVPMLPGVITEGDTLEQARARATDAIRGHLKLLRKYRQPISHERPSALGRPIQERLRVALPV